MEISKIGGYYKDLKAKEIITGKSIEKKLTSFNSKIKYIKNKQSKLYENFAQKPPKEVIVTFFRLKNRNE